MSMMTQSASSPASSRAHRCRVTASLNVLLSRSSRVTDVTMSSRLVIAVMAGSVASSITAGAAPSAAAPPAAVTAESAPAGATVTMNSGGSPGSSTAAAVRVASSGPVEVSTRQLAFRSAPVRATAASCVCSAARNGRSTKDVSGLPVAYPAGNPSSAAARSFARRIVLSCSSRNRAAGVRWKAACSSRRSAVPGRPSGAASPRSAGAAVSATASASMAPSSSVRAASISDPASAPGRPTACRSASRRPTRSASAPSGRPPCGICPPSPHCRRLPSQVQDMGRNRVTEIKINGESM